MTDSQTLEGSSYGNWTRKGCEFCFPTLDSRQSSSGVFSYNVQIARRDTVEFIDENGHLLEGKPCLLDFILEIEMLDSRSLLNPKRIDLSFLGNDVSKSDQFTIEIVWLSNQNRFGGYFEYRGRRVTPQDVNALEMKINFSFRRTS